MRIYNEVFRIKYFNACYYLDNSVEFDSAFA